MSIDARYIDAEHTQVQVTLAAGKTLGCITGPVTFSVGMQAGNMEHDALMALVSAGTVTISAAVSPITTASNTKS